MPGQRTLSMSVSVNVKGAGRAGCERVRAGRGGPDGARVRQYVMGSGEKGRAGGGVTVGGEKGRAAGGAMGGGQKGCAGGGVMGGGEKRRVGGGSD